MPALYLYHPDTPPDQRPTFESLDAGLVALLLTNDPRFRLIAPETDEEYGLIDGTVRRVLGTGGSWGSMDRPGEKEFLDLLVERDRLAIARGILGKRATITQRDIDVITDTIQWLGTPVGSGFFQDGRARFLQSEKSSLSTAGAYNAAEAIDE